MTKVVKKVADWQQINAHLRSSISKIGLVPTMGALHKGHESLIDRSISENDITVVSIFLNPTQFNDPNDLKNYPQNLNKDMSILKEYGVDFLFCPDYHDIYHDDYRFKVSEAKLGNILCGAHRSGHFDGVLTVVMKLLNIIRPDNAYFGEKDFQQYQLIKDMVSTFFMGVNIIPCPTVREIDGLALSSRNKLLSPHARQIAHEFYQALKENKNHDEIRDILKANDFEIEYIEEYDNRRFGAVILDNVRLIDNVQI